VIAKPAKSIPSRQQLLVGFVAAISGTFIVSIAAGLIPAPEESFHAPHWVVGLAGLVFVLAGASFLAPSLVAGLRAVDQYTPAQQKAIDLVRQILGCLLLTAFAAVPLWIGFGAGERMFSLSLGFSGLASEGPGRETTGRIIFGAAGILVAVWALFAWVARVRSLIATLDRTNDQATK
jgi:hypothetical protein